MACAVWLTACEGSPYVIDQFPVPVSFANGVPEVLACPANLAPCATPLPAVIDTGSAFTLIDTGQLTADSPVTQASTDVEMAAQVGTKVVTRARWIGLLPLFTYMGGPRAVFGGDALVQLAMRLDPLRQEAYFFPNIAGSSNVLARACRSVLPATPRGGGDLVFGDTTTTYPATRVVVGACLAPAALAKTPPTATSGGEVLLVVATGIPTTVISRRAFLRAQPTLTEADIDALPARDLVLPGTPPGAPPIAGRVGSIPRWAFAAQETQFRGPCQELRASRVMSVVDCPGGGIACGFCGDTAERPCRAGASVEINAVLEVIVVADDEPFLQGLRQELQPAIADVDGYLGMNGLIHVVTDFDYPGARVIFRCTVPGSSSCLTRPRLEDADARARLEDCLNADSIIDPPI
jgi:hypothetical protein